MACSRKKEEKVKKEACGVISQLLLVEDYSRIAQRASWEKSTFISTVKVSGPDFTKYTCFC